MDKQEAISFLKEDHQKLKETIGKLSPRELTSIPIIGNWSVKDILVHISAWNWEEVKAIDTVLSNKKPWYVGLTEDKFNQEEINKRRSWSLDEVLKEWSESFNFLIKRLERLSLEEWNFKTDFKWPEGTSPTLRSLFDYRYEREGHEGGSCQTDQKGF